MKPWISLFFCLAFTGLAAARPNILFILADDLGIGDLGCYGNPQLDTPVLDSLAAGGIRFTNHYAPSPLCAPSRAAFLTGRFNHRTGAVDVPSNRGLDRIAFSEKTFGHWFGQASYATALIGKWHNGLYCNDHLPHRRGFDNFFGFPNGGQDYWKWNLLANDTHVPHDGRYLTDALNDEAIRLIEKSAKSDKPFAIFLAHHVPHSPYQAPDDLVKKYRKRHREKDGQSVPIIYAMIEAMDTGLGRVFDSLKKAGLWEKTIIVFTSDNGAYLSKSTKRFHGGLSGNKGDVGEQGIRVPAIVSWPGRIPGGRVVDSPVHGCDWLPTLLRLAEIEETTARFDGIDLSKLLGGEEQPGLETRNLYFQKNRYRPVAHSDAAIRRGQWKLVWPGIPETMSKQSARDNPSYLRGIVYPHWEMPLDRELKQWTGLEEPDPRLYDLSSDPAEKKDLAGQHPKLVKELSEDYDNWFNDVMTDWRVSREAILRHDRDYWENREAPDPVELYEDFWLWSKATVEADRETTDPLKVFRGYWNDGE